MARQDRSFELNVEALSGQGIIDGIAAELEFDGTPARAQHVSKLGEVAKRIGADEVLVGTARGHRITPILAAANCEVSE